MTAQRPKPPFSAVGPGPLIIAHRGGSLEAPENTIASVRHGVACGADWQEIDVTLSRDGTVVVIHDDELQRTTNGYGLVEHTDMAALAKLVAGEPRPDIGTLAELRSLGVEPPQFGNRFKHERVPSLAQVLRVPEARLMIELKDTERVVPLARAVVDEIYRANMADRVAVGSFNFALLDAVHGIDPSLSLIGIIDDAQKIEPMLQLPLAAVSVDKNLLGKVREALPPGVAVWIWTVYSESEAVGFAEAGANGLTTDAPTAVLRRLRGSIS